MNSVCGIDEAGRGSLAGPLVVAGVILQKEIIGVNDSKKLTPKKREELFEEIIQHSMGYKIVFIDNKIIDEIGISKSIQNALCQIKETLKADDYIFDGNTNYRFSWLKNLIKADLLIKEVSAASILAKVSRDRYMDSICDNYQNYNFKNHKGYGTKEHILEIEKFGLSDIHRVSFKLKKNQPTLF
ncbi:MAG: ribonuclease HII [Campylobacterales bacterium]|nr:ribonuclease HII [Campylobacterales bacterium]